MKINLFTKQLISKTDVEDLNLIKFFKRKPKLLSNTQLGMSTSELLLLFETRSFLLEIINSKTRLAKWQKTLEEGSVYFTLSDQSISLEMTTRNRKKKWIFTLIFIQQDFQIKFINTDSIDVHYVMLDEEKDMIEEIHDIFLLIHYLDLLNTNNIYGYKKYTQNISNHLTLMNYKYSYNYGELHSNVAERLKRLISLND